MPTWSKKKRCTGIGFWIGADCLLLCSKNCQTSPCDSGQKAERFRSKQFMEQLCIDSFRTERSLYVRLSLSTEPQALGKRNPFQNVPGECRMGLSMATLLLGLEIPTKRRFHENTTHTPPVASVASAFGAPELLPPWRTPLGRSQWPARPPPGDRFTEIRTQDNGREDMGEFCPTRENQHIHKLGVLQNNFLNIIFGYSRKRTASPLQGGCR